MPTYLPPTLSICSLTSGRTSVAVTWAPSRLAVAMACRPATPAPITNTLAGGTIPAAVMNIGKYLLSSTAASRTPLYPAMLAMDDRVSMLCARVVRGMASVAKAVMPRAASARTVRR